MTGYTFESEETESWDKAGTIGQPVSRHCFLEFRFFMLLTWKDPDYDTSPV